MRFFKKKEEETVVDELEQYRNLIVDVKSETEFLKSQFENYIYTSLLNDITTFKDNLTKNSEILNSEQLFWCVNDFNNGSFYLRKKASESYRDRLSIYISYRFEENRNTVFINTINGYGDIESDRMKKIISMYYYITQSHLLKKSSLTIKKDLERVIKVVGKDTIRDGRIDEILGS